MKNKTITIDYDEFINTNKLIKTQNDIIELLKKNDNVIVIDNRYDYRSDFNLKIPAINGSQAKEFLQEQFDKLNEIVYDIDREIKAAKYKSFPKELIDEYSFFGKKQKIKFIGDKPVKSIIDKLLNYTKGTIVKSLSTNNLYQIVDKEIYCTSGLYIIKAKGDDNKTRMITIYNPILEDCFAEIIKNE
jgi:hypothetical protein